MAQNAKEILQSKIDSIDVTRYVGAHKFPDVPVDFFPWKNEISPSALYNCALPLRKQSKIKTPETKWTSIKRWTTVTPNGIKLPEGVYYSVKRSDTFMSDPEPRFEKIEYSLILLPYGNVITHFAPETPMTEQLLFMDVDGKTTLERLLDHDVEKPIAGYFKSVLKYMNENPDQIGIHLRRKNREK